MSMLNHWGIQFPSPGEVCAGDIVEIEEGWGWSISEIRRLFPCPVRSIYYYLVKRRVACRRCLVRGHVVVFFERDEVEAVFARSPRVYREEMGLRRWSEVIAELGVSRFKADALARRCGVVKRAFYVPREQGRLGRAVLFVSRQDVDLIMGVHFPR